MLRLYLTLILVEFHLFCRKEDGIRKKLLIKFLEIVSGSLITINVTVNNFKIEKK